MDSPELQRAAAMQLLLEVHEESTLWSTGGWFRSSHAPSGETEVGWPLASWVFVRWLDAGLVAVTPSAGHTAISDKESRRILADPRRWSLEFNHEHFHVIRTDATDDLESQAWLDALGPFEGAPPVGPDPLSSADFEYRSRTVDVSALRQRFLFKNGRAVASGQPDDDPA